MSEKSFQFDKFVQDLEERERLQNERREMLERQEEEWQVRELNRRYREHPHNRIIRNQEKK
tara:strand:- start:5699 stop:5881 length:183 start_codon:yes stop_codon:yes gene_type:complete